MKKDAPGAYDKILDLIDDRDEEDKNAGLLYQAQIWIRMEPRYIERARKSLNTTDTDPDLILWFDQYHFEHNQDTLDQLHKGD